MKQNIIILLCLFPFFVDGQTVPSLNIGYTYNSLVEGQTELGLKTNLYNSIFFEITGSTNFEKSNSLSLGVGFPFYQNNNINLQTTIKAVIEHFVEDSGVEQLTYNYELPIELNYLLSKRYFLHIGIIPTYNTYDFKGSSIQLGYIIGMGYKFFD